MTFVDFLSNFLLAIGYSRIESRSVAFESNALMRDWEPKCLVKNLHSNDCEALPTAVMIF